MKLTLLKWEVLYQLTSVIIKHKNGKVFDLDKLGYHVKTFEPWGIDWNQSTTAINRYLQIQTSSKIQPKSMTLELNTMASDMTGLQLRFLDLTKIFNGEYSFWIYFADIPYIRWEVTVNNAPTFTAIGNAGFGSASIPLYCPKGVAETTHSTAEITPTGTLATQYSVGLFGLGTHFEHGGKRVPYYSGTNAYQIPIFNPGSIALRAKGLHGKILISAQKGICSHVTITNNTNGTSFSYKKTFSQLTLDGYHCNVDGKLDFTNTDHGYIDIERLWNDFTIDCDSTFTVKFDLNFYY